MTSQKQSSGNSQRNKSKNSYRDWLVITLLVEFVIILLLLMFRAPGAVAEVQYLQKIDQNTQAVIDAVFHEARSEPFLGQILVIKSIQNRAKDPHWKADTYHEVVYQPYQYSFTLLDDKSLMQRVLRDHDTYERISKFVPVILESPVEPKGFEGVNHYLRCDIRDKVDWWHHMEFLGAVGNHCFYRGY